MREYPIAKMDLGQRLRTSWSLLRRGRMPAKARRRSGTVMLWPRWREQQAEWNLVDLTSFIEEGFNLNSIIYSCIMYKVRAAQSAVLRAYIGTREQSKPAPPDHPLTRLLDRPNPFQSFPEMDSELRVYFNLFGNCYVWFQRKTRRDYPEAMLALRPDRVNHLYIDGKLAGFAFTPVGAALRDSIPLLPEDTMHVRLPNPGDPFMGMGKGLSPMFPLAQTGDVDNSATAFIKQFFDHGAMPQGALEYDLELTDEDAATARERWMEVYGGSRNWTDIAILDQGSSYKQIGVTLDDLGIANLDARNESRMVMPFGVPLTLIETRPVLVQATYNNKRSDRQMFWEDTMTPELRLFEVEWSFFLTGEDGAFPAYDYGNVPALQEIRNDRAALLLEGVRAAAVMRSEFKEALGLPFGPDDQVYLMPIGLIAVPAGPAPAALADEGERARAEEDEEQRDETEGQQTDTEVPEEEPTETAALLPMDRKQLELSLDAKQNARDIIDKGAEAWEEATAEAAWAAFEEDRRNILAIVNGAKVKALEDKASISWTAAQLAMSEYLAGPSEDQWRAKFTPVFRQIITSQTVTLNAVFGFEFATQDLLAQDWFRNYQLVFVDPISKTSTDQITPIFQQAFSDGWSIPQMEGNLDILFKQWMDGDVLEEMSEEALEQSYFATQRLPNWRKEIIARTESLRASNYGAMNLYKAWGVPGKEWISTGDGRTRPAHQVGVVWGQNPLVVAIDDTFSIGGAQMQVPGDVNAPMELVANCRCTTVPAMVLP